MTYGLSVTTDIILFCLSVDSTGEDCIVKLRDILENDLQLQPSIENAHRIGPFKDDGTPRLFLYRPERFRIIKKKRDLRDGMRVSDDLMWEEAGSVQSGSRDGCDSTV